MCGWHSVDWYIGRTFGKTQSNVVLEVGATRLKRNILSEDYDFIFLPKCQVIRTIWAAPNERFLNHFSFKVGFLKRVFISSFGSVNFLMNPHVRHASWSVGSSICPVGPLVCRYFLKKAGSYKFVLPPEHLFILYRWERQ